MKFQKLKLYQVDILYIHVYTLMLYIIMCIEREKLKYTKEASLFSRLLQEVL